MSLKKCGRCGFSRYVALMTTFNNNGTITEKLQKDFRVILIEASYLTEVFKSIEKELGIPISHIVFEAQRNASRATIESNTKGPFRLARIGPFKKIAVWIFCQIAIWTGMGYAKALKYKTGKRGEAQIKNPFNKEMMAANIVGAFESLENKPFSYKWKDFPQDDVIAIEPEPERPEIAKRLEFKNPPLKPGRRQYSRCRSCGVPEDLSALEWREKDGIIIDKKTDIRMVFLDSYMTNAVLRELVRELGEEVKPIIVEAQRIFSLNHLRKENLHGQRGVNGSDKSLFINEVLDTIAMRGQGNPVGWTRKDDDFIINVDNPFNEEILAGTFSAMYEIATGKLSSISTERVDDATLTYRVYPKK